MLAQVEPLRQVVESVEAMARALFAALPRLALAGVVVVVAWYLGRLVRRLLAPRLARFRTPSFAQVFATLAQVGVVVVGILVALPVAFPTVDAATLLAGLGLLGVAAGFAFSDILSNLLAGLLLIFRQPFVSGDQIEVNGLRGTVEGITIRETRLRTFEGRLIVVPNKDVYENAIDVQTDREVVRSSLVVGVSYDSDLAHARQVALTALGGIEGIRAEPAPQAYYVGFGASSIDLDLRYWTESRQAAVRAVQDRAVEAVKSAFDGAGIDVPFEIVTLESGDTFAEALAGARETARSGDGAARG